MLAEKLVKRIAKDGEVTLDQLDASAVKHGIDMNVMDNALQRIHKLKNINRRTKKGTVVYSLQVIKPKSPTPHLDWVRDNYPPMTSSNDGSGIDMDFSYLFLTPEEMEKYKAEAKGRVYIPKKKYNRKEAVPPTPVQQSLIDMFKTEV